MVAGAVVVAAGWLAVARRWASIWVAQAAVLAVVGIAALVTGRVHLSASVNPGTAAGVGVASGVVLYAATAAFVAVVRRWRVFDRHVAAIYALRGNLPLAPTLALACVLAAPGEEVFWRGLFLGTLAEGRLGWAGGAVATWVVYVAANLPSANLPIAAGAVVAGAVWTALGWWSHGVLAAACCHVVWTGLMIVRPPGGGSAPEPGVPERPRASDPPAGPTVV